MSRLIVRKLYGLIDANLDTILETIRENIAACLESGTFNNLNPPPYGRVKVINIVTGAQIFKPLAVLMSEYGLFYSR